MIRREIKGYTLMELIVVLALIVIMMSMAVGGIMAYVKYSQYKQNDEQARTIFGIVQNALTQEKNNGTLSELEEFAVEKAGETGAIKSCGNMPIPENATSETSAMYSRLYYFNIGEGFNGSDDEVKNKLKELVEKYIYDEDIWNGALCVELDPSDGVVKAVWYCRQANRFVYGDTAEGENLSEGIIMIGNPNVDRRAKRLGYYGADDLSAAAPEDKGKPIISYLRLDNEELLDLNWAMDRKFIADTRKFDYKIEISVKADGSNIDQKRLALNLKGSSLTNVEENYQLVSCDYIQYNALGNETGNGTIELMAKIGALNSDIHLIFDATDLYANGILANKGINSNDYKNTLSGKKLIDIAGIDINDNIKATVQAVNDSYNASSRKSSSEQNVLMGGIYENDTFLIQNARHLYNMRFVEAYYKKNNKNAEINYKQTETFAWGGDNGLIKGNYVYNTEGSNGLAIVSDTDTNFPMLEEFMAKHSFTATSGKEMQKINLSYSGNDKVGLIRENNGTLNNLTLTDTNVIGKDNVGSFCGVNSGTLKYLTTKNGSVEGHENVGGILGYFDSSVSELWGLVSYMGKAELLNLSNGANVTGVSYVGGITGKIENTSTSANESALSIISDCSNTGLVHAANSNASNIGGIVGYTKKCQIKNCESTPGNDTISIDNNTTKENIASYLLGTNVGGIVGSCEYTYLTDCQTNGGYVFGQQYVGGIVGKYSDIGEGVQASSLLVRAWYWVLENVFGINIGESGTIDLEGNGKANNSMVIGESYVGGIVGSNGGTVSDWKNTGIVCATNEYAGGITGYNSGTVTKCITATDTFSTSGDDLVKIAKNIGGEGNYIGGIAGYNSGEISFTSAENGSCVVAGNDYVGGIVGRNEGKINSCSTEGAYISGNDYVGGMFGANFSKDAIINTGSSNIIINSIEGNSYVGGFVGYNYVEDSDDIDVNNVVIKNSLGYIETTGQYVGGIIGYNDVAGKMTLKGCEITLARILGNNESENGGTYIGGLIGGNNENNGSLLIQECTNNTNITANGIIINEESNEEFAYCGGIIGKVTKNTTIDECTISKDIDVIHGGTYFGCIAEINEGIIKNCTVENIFGDAGDNNVGGIVGLNSNVEGESYDTSGYIESCEFKGIVIGSNNVGGIVSKNTGIIKNVKVSGEVTGYGENTGGIVGQNVGENSVGSQRGTITGSNTINCTVVGTGENTGGAIGSNSGIVDDSSILQGSKLSITGNKNVGGFIGKEITEKNGDINGKLGHIANLTNEVDILATGGNVGGIIGSIEGSGFMLSECANNGVITANAGDAGGITAVNNYGNTIYGCTNANDVIAAKSENNGAIVGLNYGLISKCSLEEKNSILNKSINVTGYKYVGGFVGVNGKIDDENYGVIKDLQINCKINVAFADTTGDSAIGGLCGINWGSIENTASFGEGSIEVSTSKNDVPIGGIVGSNKGTIDGGDNKISPSVVVGDGVSAPIGGIVGNNIGSIENLVFGGKITAQGSADYGIGGIVGVNGSENINNETAIVKNCKIDDGISRSLNKASGVDYKYIIDSNDYTINTSFNDTMVSVGGIVGYNCENGTVEGSTLVNCYIRADYGYSGGIVGHNYGVVKECKAESAIEDEEEYYNSSKPDLRVKLTKHQGDLGGIVGRNEISGQVYNSSTGRDWYVLVTRTETNNASEGTDNTISGGIGYNCSNFDVYGIVNCADVSKYLSKSTIGSGIIGRQENITSETFMLKDCINYGDINTGYRGSGMISQWKYNGGTLKSCKNYGSITSRSANGTGGMVGSFYGLSANQNVTIAFCDNFGDMGNTQQLGGIVGTTKDCGSNTVLYIYRCTNSGYTKSTTTSGGIIGDSSGSAKVTVDKCINYYRYGTADIGSISGSSNGNLTVTNCINVPTNNRNIDSAGTKAISNNSYFGRLAGGSFDPNTVVPINLEGRIVTLNGITSNTTGNVTNNSGTKITDGDIKYIYDNDYNTAFRYQRSSSWANTGLGFEIDVKDENGEGRKVNNIEVTAGTSTSDRTYFYRFSFYIKNISEPQYLTLDHTTSGKLEDAATFASDTAYGSKSANCHVSNIYELEEPLENVEKIRVEVINVVNGESTATSSSNYAVINEIKVNKIDDSIASEENEGELLLYSYNEDNEDCYYAYNIKQGRKIPKIPYNPNDNKHKTDTAKEQFDDIQPVMIAYYKSLMSADAETPQNIVLKMDSGKYTATWDEAQGGYMYRVDVMVYENDDWVIKKTENVDVGTMYSFVPENEWISVGKSIKVGVTTLNGNYDEKKSDTYNFELKYMSGTGYSDAIGLGNVLPTPKITYELIDNKGTYACKLLNLSDYQEYIDEGQAGSIEIQPGANAAFNNLLEDKKFYLSDYINGNYKTFTFTSENTSFYVSAQAIATGELEGNVINSVKYYVQTQVYSLDTLRGTSIATYKDSSYFTGIDPTELRLNTTLSAPDEKHQAYRYTGIYYDNVTYGTNYMRISSTHNIALGGMKTIGYGEPISVRSYPWGTQNLGISYGHIVEEGVSETRAKNFIGQKGYDVRAVEDTDTYDIYYSVMLEYSDFNSQVLIENKKLPNGVEDVKLCNNPTIEENGMYTFTWEDPNGSGGTYNVSIRGAKTEGSGDDEKNIYTLISTLSDISENSISISPSNWDYNKIKVEVSRIGQVGSDYHTVNMGSYAEKVYDISLNLPSINKPTVKIVNKDDLEYNVSWSGYSVGTQQYEDAKGYEVWVYGKKNNTGEDAWNVEATGLTLSDNKAVIDLEDYQGQSVRIAVVAKINSTYKVYSADSLPSLYQSLTVPNRKDLGTITYSLSPASGEDPMTMSDFVSKGFTFKVENSTTTEKGRYVVKGDVYSSAGNEFDSSKTYGISNADTSSPTLYSMNNTNGSSLTEATYTFRGVPVDYAGQYLRVAVRSTSDSGISSVWSGVVSLQMPSVRLNTPALMQSTVGVEYNVLGTNDDVLGTVDAMQRVIYWSWDSYAKEYKIVITPIVGNGGTVQNIVISKTGNSYTVSNNGSAISNSGTSDDRKYIIDSYGYTVSDKFENDEYKFNTNAMVEIRGDNCYIVLPDYDEYTLSSDYTVGDSYKYTFTVDVMAVSENESFKESGNGRWQRVYNSASKDYNDGEIE